MKKRSIVLIIFFLCWGLSSLCITAQETPKEPLDQKAQLAKVFFEMNRLDRPGGAVIVLKEGKEILKKGFGLAGMEAKNPITPTTMFDAAAIARPVTAMAVLMLAQEGKLSLEDDIRKHITELPDYGKTIRIRHLLYNTSGIWDWTKILPAVGWKLDDVITLENITYVLEQQKKPTIEPGSKYVFSHSNYTLLAEIVKRVSGKDYREWAWRNMFRPLKMRNSLFRDRHGEPVENQAMAYIYNRMVGYDRDSGNLDAVGSHNLYTSVEELAKWALNLESGTVGGKKVVEKLLAPGLLNNGKEMKYAAGFEIDKRKGFKRYSANGSWQGFNASFQYFPEPKFTVILLTNWESRWNYPADTCQQIADIFLKEQAKEKKVEKKTEKKKAEAVETKKTKAVVTVKMETLKRYEGEYRYQASRYLYILIEKEKLKIKFSKRGRAYELAPMSDTKFNLLVAPYIFTFKTDNKGVVSGNIDVGDGNPEALTKIERVKLTGDQLKDYEGTFYCKAMDTKYVVAVKDKKLTISNLRLKKITISPELKDTFIANSRIFRIVFFKRDKQQKITGLELKDLGLSFRKI